MALSGHHILRCIAGGVPLGMGCARMPHFHKIKKTLNKVQRICRREHQLAARGW